MSMNAKRMFAVLMFLVTMSSLSVYGSAQPDDETIAFGVREALREDPRVDASTLFTKFHKAYGEKHVWTTFSPDQIDLKYKNPEVLLKIIDIFLFYLSQGVEIIRLDAIGDIWKEHHTPCVNLSKTHQIVRLFRSIMEYVAPYALILTEANFPYKENIA